MMPIFRAKKLDSDEYVKGYLVRADDYDADVDEDQVIYFIMDKMENYRTSEVWDFVQNSRIDPTTLSIHFPNIIDSQGNKIFASLQEDGKGGDVLNSGYSEVVIAVYEEGMIKFRYEEALPYNHTTIDKIEDENFLSFYEVWQIRDKLESEVVGIQE